MTASEKRSTSTPRRSKVLLWIGSAALALAMVSCGVNAGDSGSSKKKIRDPTKGPDLRKMNGQVSAWPGYGEKPETNTPEVKAWVKEVDWSKVPKLPIRKVKHSGDPPLCPDHVKDSDCWWTCTGCHAPDDIIDCPDTKAWGLTYDDGPEPQITERLLKMLGEKNYTATMFVTGMKSSQAPYLLKEILSHGHHLASHSWSHSGMTTLTNEEIVAELKWTEKYIFDHTGYRVKYFRPPYGDIDNRVRAIARQLGYKIVIWTDGWDSQDWQLEEHTITEPQIVKLWKGELGDVTKRRRGVVTLEHDGDRQFVNVARTLLEMGIAKGMRPMDIPKCVHDPIGYREVPKPANTTLVVPKKEAPKKVVAAKPAVPAPVAVAKKEPPPAPAPEPAVVEEPKEEAIEPEPVKDQGVNAAGSRFTVGSLVTACTLGALAIGLAM
ncbi:chitin deacetylase [Actinomortierella ambigua]|uniref:Chitin deacetylase n=1 Tax=Actinomortierella ambigua TaxID=1343610 RepID=A0A9P6QDH9_9FUNG|nr:chitin deacetylase [Actinomortierella ambigua]KAG0264257.1 chitin deacetylase [Actinomortierella ambigua]